MACWVNERMADLLTIGVDPAVVAHATAVYGEALGGGAVRGGDAPTGNALARSFALDIEGALRGFCQRLGRPFVAAAPVAVAVPLVVAPEDKDLEMNGTEDDVDNGYWEAQAL